MFWLYIPSWLIFVINLPGFGVTWETHYWAQLPDISREVRSNRGRRHTLNVSATLPRTGASALSMRRKRSQTKVDFSFLYFLVHGDGRSTNQIPPLTLPDHDHLYPLKPRATMDSSSLTPRLLPRAPLTGIKPDSLGLSSCEAALEKMDSEFPICKMGLIIYFSCSAVSKRSASAGLQAFSSSVFICSSVYLSPRSDSRRTEHADI